MGFKIVLLTQYAPLYMGPFLDRFLQHLDRVQFEVKAVVAFSPVFKATMLDEAKARLGMYGPVDFTKISVQIAIEKLRSKLYQLFGVGRCASLENVNAKYSLTNLFFESPNSEAFKNYLVNHEVDLLVSIACPKMLKAEVLSIPKHGAINYHTGALPKYRGRQPLFWAKLAQEAKMGISIHEMVPALDAGPIISQHWIENKPSDSLHDLYVKTIQIGPLVLLEALSKIQNGVKDRIANPDDQSTKFKFPEAKEGREYKRRGLKYI